MEYKPIIMMPVHKRADYPKRVLESIRNCYGSEKYTVIICAEPGYPEVIEVLKSVEDIHKIFIINEKKLGCDNNTYKCLELGFNFTDFLIIFEDDIIPSRDCLQYFEWAKEEYKNDPDVLNIGTFTDDIHGVAGMKNMYETKKYEKFTSQGWGTWINRWENIIKPNWEDMEKEGYPDWFTWDVRMDRKIRGNRVEVRPILGRTNNIGKENGLHSETVWNGIKNSDHYRYDNKLCSIWAGNIIDTIDENTKDFDILHLIGKAFLRMNNKKEQIGE